MSLWSRVKGLFGGEAATKTAPSGSKERARPRPEEARQESSAHVSQREATSSETSAEPPKAPQADSPTSQAAEVPQEDLAMLAVKVKNLKPRSLMEGVLLGVVQGTAPNIVDIPNKKTHEERLKAHSDMTTMVNDVVAKQFGDHAEATKLLREMLARAAYEVEILKQQEETGQSADSADGGETPVIETPVIEAPAAEAQEANEQGPQAIAPREQPTPDGDTPNTQSAATRPRAGRKLTAHKGQTPPTSGEEHSSDSGHEAT